MKEERLIIVRKELHRKRVTILGIRTVVCTISIIGIVTTLVNAYGTENWYLYGKTGSFKWGSNIQISGSTVRTAWETAIEDWDEACSAYFYYASLSESTLDSQHIDDSEHYGDMEVYAPSGSVHYFHGYINAWNTNISRSNVARSTANHELGHVLGLADLRSGVAIMNQRRERTSIYVPQNDDLAGIEEIYGE